MASKRVDTKAILTVGFLLFTFASGLLIMLASKRNTEDRSRASGPYNPCSAVCRAGVPADVCTACKIANHITPSPSHSISPTPRTGDPWNDCAEWVEATGACVRTYRQKKKDMDADWRCNSITRPYGLCPTDYTIEWPPGNP